MEPDQSWVVRDAAELEALYPAPFERSVRKQIDHVDEYCRTFIARAPFLIIGTQGPRPDSAGDASPRGDTPGFVRVADDFTLLIPDRRGNNRIDALHNIV